MKRIIATLYLIIILVMGAQAQIGSPVPKYEARAVWLTTIGGIDWPHSYAQSERSIAKQKQELTTILDQLQRAGINQVLLQTRVRGTTIYPSAYEPWDGCLSGVPGRSPGYDALRFAIDECHRRGMELHAWIVAIPVGRWNGLGCRRLRQRYPQLVRRIGDEGYMDPEQAQTGRYIADLCEEIVRQYDVDGIHLDYIRYPETWNIRVTADRGRRYITAIVKAIHDRIKPIKPYVKMSCAPIGKYDDLTRYFSYGWNARTRVCQDAQAWLRDGLMDELFPMMYFRGQQFYPFAIDWSENTYGRIVAPGLGIYFLSPREKDWPIDVVTREMQILRQYGLGHAFFRSKFLTDNVKGIYDYTLTHDASLALVPPMTWEHSAAPAAPTQLRVQGDSMLVWQAAPLAAPIYYNVYASATYPVDIADGRHLVAVRRADTHLPIPTTGRYYYAVTATDRFGLESPALQMAAPRATEMSAATRLLPCDGRWLQLPKSEQGWSRHLVAQITDMAGRQVDTRLWTADRIDIGSLPEGMYQLYSLTSRGIRHRHGQFVVRRR